MDESSMGFTVKNVLSTRWKIFLSKRANEIIISFARLMMKK
jgi:hypothetical protein